MLLQHPEFSAVPENTSGTLYSVLDTNTALAKLEAICPPYDDSDEKIAPTDGMTRMELLFYCLLDTAHQMVLNVDTLPPTGYLKLAESILGTHSTTLCFKAMTLLCVLQSKADSLLERDTLGVITLDETELASTFDLRATTARLLSKAKSTKGDSQSRQLLFESVKRKFNEDSKFLQKISSSVNSQRDATHLAIIKLDDSVAQRQMTLPQRVQEYFRHYDLEPLLCPVSQRPMTEAVYLRCGKTVNQTALEELVAGNIPESHCCCEEIHVDIAHKLHDCPLVSDLAIRHVRRILKPSDVVKYGDLPTLRFMIPEIQDKDKIELLHTSITLKNIAITTFLSSTGMDVNLPIDDKTPLARAASLGSTELVMALLHNGARPDDRDTNGRSALTHAALNNHSAVTRILFKNVSDITLESALSGENEVAEDRRGQCATALHDLWLGSKEFGDEKIVYLQRAMELDPENHFYAEEMQEYLDDQESGEADRVYTSCIGEQL